MVVYTDSAGGLAENQLSGFFAGWLQPPSPASHLRLLQQSTHVVLALDEQSHQVVGFVTALSDGVLSAYIPLLEVLPSYQGHGIGSELVRRILSAARNLYAVDLLCDPELQPFYARLGLQPATGMMLRRPDRSRGAPPE